MSEILETAYQKFSDEYEYFGAVKRLYTNAVENGITLSSTRFGDTDLADQNSENYVNGMREAAARIEDFGSVILNIAGKEVITVKPEIDDHAYDDGSFSGHISLDTKRATRGDEINDVSGAFTDVFVRVDRDGLGVKVTPHMLLRNAQRDVHTIRGEGGIPLMSYQVETFATAPLDGTADISVPRFETLDRYRRALGMLAEKGSQYPWFTDTAVRLIEDLDNNRIDIAGKRVRQLGSALDRLDDKNTYRQGVETLSGILCGSDVIVYGDAPEGNDRLKHVVVKGSLIDIEGNKALDPTSIVVEAYNNGEQSIYRMPMKSVISVQQIE